MTCLILRVVPHQPPQGIYKFNDILKPPTDQALRNMRHHVHCKDLDGKVGYYPQLSQIDRGLGGD